MNISIPFHSLVVLFGSDGAFRKSFCKEHFTAGERVAPQQSSESLLKIVDERLALGGVTVVDGSHLSTDVCRSLVRSAKRAQCAAVAVVLNSANETRPLPSPFPENALRRDGFRQLIFVESAEETESVSITRVALACDRRDELGPFDIIGDIHGCCDELEELLNQLGYERRSVTPGGPSLESGPVYAHPTGRKALFLGDLIDRGPRILDTVRLVFGMVKHGSALCVSGNHDDKLLRKLTGRNPQMTHGFALTISEIDGLPDASREAFCVDLSHFLESLPSHYVLDRGRLVVAHAGLKEEHHGKQSNRERVFALYGDTTGETDANGLPIRLNWAADYRGSAMVVYGHTPIPKLAWENNTVNIDTGCVFGGALTALRYPEREFLSVPAKQTYRERPGGFQLSSPLSSSIVD